MDSVVLAARKHGIDDEDMLHAYPNQSEPASLGDLVMLIGKDGHGHLLEVGIAEGEGAEFIIHAMPARSKFL